MYVTLMSIFAYLDFSIPVVNNHNLVLQLAFPSSWTDRQSRASRNIPVSTAFGEGKKIRQALVQLASGLRYSVDFGWTYEEYLETARHLKRNGVSLIPSWFICSLSVIRKKGWQADTRSAAGFVRNSTKFGGFRQLSFVSAKRQVVNSGLFVET